PRAYDRLRAFLFLGDDDVDHARTRPAARFRRQCARPTAAPIPSAWDDAGWGCRASSPAQRERRGRGRLRRPPPRQSPRQSRRAQASSSIARCSKKITGSLPRRLPRSSPTASSALDGTATFHPGLCTNSTSLVIECHGSPHLKKPPGTRRTIGAAKRLWVRQRIVPQSWICSVAGSAYLRNWISGTGISPASAIPTARPTLPSSLRLV